MVVLMNYPNNLRMRLAVEIFVVGQAEQAKVMDNLFFPQVNQQ